MWELVTDWDAIASTPLADATASLLEFADDCMLLVRVSEDCSGDLVQESSVQSMGIGSQSAASEVKSKQ